MLFENIEKLQINLYLSLEKFCRRTREYPSNSKKVREACVDFNRETREAISDFWELPCIEEEIP